MKIVLVKSHGLVIISTISSTVYFLADWTTYVPRNVTVFMLYQFSIIIDSLSHFPSISKECLYHRVIKSSSFSWTVRDEHCTWHSLWPSIWSKTTPSSGHPYAKSHACSHTSKHSNCCGLVIHRANSQLMWPRARHSSRSWTICAVDDPNPVCLWPPSMPC